jgi:hypothetical protein
MSGIPPVVAAVWALFALFVLVGVFFVLRAERRRYVAAGQQGAWLAVRLATLPIAAVALAVVIAGSRQVSGMEALALFYALLLSVAPLLYFGLHVGVARLAGLRAGQGMRLAALGLAILLAPAAVAVPAQIAGYSAQHWWSKFESNRAEMTPPAHSLVAAGRHLLPAGEELWSQYWRADSTVRGIEGLEVPPDGEVAAPGRQPFRSFGSWICRDRMDLHVTWPASMGETTLTVRWRDAAGRLKASQLRVAPPAGEPAPMVARWSAEGVSLPVRPPRVAAWTARAKPEGKLEYFGSLNAWQPHESPQDFCLPRPYRGSNPLGGIALRIERRNGEPLRAEFARPAD